MESPRRRIRNLIRKVLKTNSDIESFVLDNFTNAWQQVSSGMKQDLIINLLFEHYNLRQVLERLEEYDTENLIKKELADLEPAVLDDFVPSGRPAKLKMTLKARAKVRDLIILVLGGMLWEKLRNVLSPILQYAKNAIKNGRAAAVTAVGILLITVGVALRDSQHLEIRSSERDMQASIGPSIRLSNDSEVLSLPPVPIPREPVQLPSYGDMSNVPPGSAPSKDGGRPKSSEDHFPDTRLHERAIERLSSASSEAMDMSSYSGIDLTQPTPSPPPQHDLEVVSVSPTYSKEDRPEPGHLNELGNVSERAHLAEPRHLADLGSRTESVQLRTQPHLPNPSLLREPMLLICPDRVAVQVEPGSDTKVDQRRAAEQLILEMKSKSSDSQKLIVLPRCSNIREADASSSVQVSTTLMIENRIVENTKKCPVGSTRNCYNSLQRKILCKFSFSITSHPAGYACGKMKSAPPEYEITYFESDIDPVRWTASRRGDYAIDKCRQLAGVLTQGNLCQPQ